MVTRMEGADRLAVEVRDAGGETRLDGEVGRGTTSCVTLPVARALAEDTPASYSPGPRSETPAPTGGP